MHFKPLSSSQDERKTRHRHHQKWRWWLTVSKRFGVVKFQAPQFAPVFSWNYQTMLSLKELLLNRFMACSRIIRNWRTTHPPCLSPLDFWNIECHSIFFQFQTRKKNRFWNSIFLLSSNLIFTACVACKNRVRTRKKNRVSKSIFFFEFEINSEIPNSKIKCRETGGIVKWNSTHSANFDEKFHKPQSQS